MAFIRQGTCNRCGQCCGADGSPNQANPWGETFLYAYNRWREEDRPLMIQAVGGTPALGGPINSALKLDNVTYRAVWVYDVGLCKNLPPWGDDTTYSLECPFLADDPGDGSRPCALVGTPWESVYLDKCFPEGPAMFYDQQSLDQWESDHPLCSHSWVEV